MQQVTANQLRDQLTTLVDRVISNHEPLHVARRRGGDFVVISLEDFEAEQETLTILNETQLVAQNHRSLQTMQSGDGQVVGLDEL